MVHTVGGSLRRPLTSRAPPCLSVCAHIAAAAVVSAPRPASPAAATAHLYTTEMPTQYAAQTPQRWHQLQARPRATPRPLLSPAAPNAHNWRRRNRTPLCPSKCHKRRGHACFLGLLGRPDSVGEHAHGAGRRHRRGAAVVGVQLLPRVLAEAHDLRGRGSQGTCGRSGVRAVSGHAPGGPGPALGRRACGGAQRRWRRRPCSAT